MKNEQKESKDSLVVIFYWQREKRRQVCAHGAPPSARADPLCALGPRITFPSSRPSIRTHILSESDFGSSVGSGWSGPIVNREFLNFHASGPGPDLGYFHLVPRAPSTCHKVCTGSGK